MSDSLAVQICDAQLRLQLEVVAALDKFSTKTGLIVRDMSWDVALVFDARGETACAGYHSIKTDMCGPAMRPQMPEVAKP